MKKNTNELLTIITQAFYGNRTVTEIKEKNVDGFILGNVDGTVSRNEKIDRTVIKVPGTDNLVIIFNKFAEEESLKEKERYLEEDGYVLKPLASIPELGFEIYSRCIVCRIDKDETLESVLPEDCEKFMKYLAK